MTYFIDDFEKSAIEYADNIAIKQPNGDYLTYAELNARINKLAHHLKSKMPSINEGDCIGIRLPRSLDLVVTMLACWKINASFAILKPNTQPEISKNMLEEYKAIAIITNAENDLKIPSIYHHILLDDKQQNETIAQCSEKNTKRSNKNGVCAYIINSSGTTKAAKAIPITHEQEENGSFEGALRSTAEVLELNPNDTFLWNSPLTFDPIIAELCVFYYGASLYIPNEETLTNLEEVSDLQELIDHQVNVQIILPNKIPALINHNRGLHKIKNLKFMSTGDTLKEDHVKTLTHLSEDPNDSVLVANGYGPSEGPIGLTCTRCKLNEPVSIHNTMKGRKIDVVVIEEGIPRPAQDGETGEIIYQSKGFNRYLNNPSATDEVKLNYKGAAWWRTGDLAQVAGKKLLFQSRLGDNFVKIKSTRIDLPPIQVLLSDHPAIKEAYTVGIYDEHKYPTIVSYIKLKKNQHPPLSSLIKHVHDGHMTLMMHKIVIIDDDDDMSHHNTANSKRNKKSLKNKYQDKIFGHKDNETRKECLAHCWEEIFGIEVNDKMNFFLDFDQQSLSLTDLRVRIENDPVFNIDEFDDSMVEEFRAQGGTLPALERIISENQSRKGFIQRHHNERENAPLFVIGDLEPEKLLTLSDIQPIYHIQQNSTVPQEKSINDLAKSIRYYQPLGPYFILWDDPKRDQLEALLSQKVAHSVEFCDKTTESKSCKQAYEDYCKLIVDKKLVHLAHTLTIDLEHASHHSLTKSLYHEGFNATERSLLYKQPLTIIFKNIQRPDQLAALIQDPIFKKFECAKFQLHIEPGLFSHDSFTYKLDQQDKEIEIKWHSNQKTNITDDSLIDWFQQKVDKVIPSGTPTEKAALFERLYSYASKLAITVCEADFRVPYISSRYEEDYQVDPISAELFDPYEPETQLAFKAAPISINYDEDSIYIQFLTPTIQQYLIDHPHSSQNPFKTNSTDHKTLLLERLNNVAQLYHPDGHLPPLYLLAPITGDDIFGLFIQHLPQQLPIYVLQHPTLTQVSKKFYTIPELSEYYLESIMARSPTGPIALAGFSFGGLVANEIAQQLLKHNREISYLGILDSTAPGHQAHDHYKFFAQICTIYKIPNFEPVLKAAFTEHPNDLPKIWNTLNRYVKSEKLARHVAMALDVCEQNYSAYLSYMTPASTINNRFIYKSTVPTQYCPFTDAEDLHWPVEKDHCVQIANADHFSLLQRYVTELTKAVNTHLPHSTDTIADTFSMLDNRIRAHVTLTLKTLQAHQPEELTELHSKYFFNPHQSAVIIGDSGIGKSTLLRELYNQCGQDFLNSNDQPIPLFFSFSDRVPFQFYLDSLSLTQIQLEGLSKRNIILFVDGIDEAESTDAFRNSMDTVRSLKCSNITLIASCKKEYFKQTPDIKNYLARYFSCREQCLKPMNMEQCFEYLSNTIYFQNTKIYDWLINYIRLNLTPSITITPRYLHELCEYGYQLATQNDFKLGHYGLAELFRLKFDILASQSSLSQKTVFNFCEQLTLSLYGFNDTYQESLQPNRYDTQELIQLLQLQRTPKGFNFSHRSEQEYFMAKLLFEEFLDANHIPVILNQFNLAYEFDILKLIGAIYHDYVYSNEKMTHQRRIDIQELLNSTIKLARNNADYKILAANMLSIKSACSDASLRFAEDISDIYFADVNLSNSVIDVDFSKSYVENAILDGASINDRQLLPQRWLQSLPITTLKRNNWKPTYQYNDMIVKHKTYPYYLFSKSEYYDVDLSLHRNITVKTSMAAETIVIKNINAINSKFTINNHQHCLICDYIDIPKHKPEVYQHFCDTAVRGIQLIQMEPPYHIYKRIPQNELFNKEAEGHGIEFIVSDLSRPLIAIFNDSVNSIMIFDIENYKIISRLNFNDNIFGCVFKPNEPIVIFCFKNEVWAWDYLHQNSYFVFRVQESVINKWNMKLFFEGNLLYLVNNDNVYKIDFSKLTKPVLRKIINEEFNHNELSPLSGEICNIITTPFLPCLVIHTRKEICLFTNISHPDNFTKIPIEAFRAWLSEDGYKVFFVDAFHNAANTINLKTGAITHQYTIDEYRDDSDRFQFIDTDIDYNLHNGVIDIYLDGTLKHQINTRRLSAYRNALSAIEISNDAHYLCTAANTTGNIQIWNLYNQCSMEHSFQVPVGNVTALAFIDLDYLVVSTDINSVFIYEFGLDNSSQLATKLHSTISKKQAGIDFRPEDKRQPLFAVRHIEKNQVNVVNDSGNVITSINCKSTAACIPGIPASGEAKLEGEIIIIADDTAHIRIYDFNGRELGYINCEPNMSRITSLVLIYPEHTLWATDKDGNKSIYQLKDLFKQPKITLLQQQTPEGKCSDFSNPVTFYSASQVSKSTLFKTYSLSTINPRNPSNSLAPESCTLL